MLHWLGREAGNGQRLRTLMLISIDETLPLDASCILEPFLWQGSVPPPGDYLSKQGFKALVLCAEEWLYASSYPGLDVLCAPNKDDGTLSQKQLERAKAAARWVSRKIDQNQKVLITCMSGWNRSGLVSAWVLRERFGWSGKKCIDRVRAKREWALTNQAFVQSLLPLT